MSLVWHDLGLNPGLLDNWWTLLTRNEPVICHITKPNETDIWIKYIGLNIIRFWFIYFITYQDSWVFEVIFEGVRFWHYLTNTSGHKWVHAWKKKKINEMSLITIIFHYSYFFSINNENVYLVSLKCFKSMRCVLFSLTTVMWIFIMNWSSSGWGKIINTTRFKYKGLLFTISFGYWSYKNTWRRMSDTMLQPYSQAFHFSRSSLTFGLFFLFKPTL